MMQRDTLIRALKFLREKLDKDMPIQQALVFLLIGDQPTITQPELCALTGMPQGSVCRHLVALGHYTRKPNAAERKEGKKEMVSDGMDLLTIHPDLTNRRRLAYSLNTKGQSILRQLDLLLLGEKIE